MTTNARAPLTFELFPEVTAFTLTSADVSDGTKLDEVQVASSMGYGGANQSPHLHWSGFPATTKSFALTIHDPDAPTGSGFWHWVVVDIPVSITELPTGAGSEDGTQLPEGAVSFRNDAGTVGYFGAAPPAGDEPHRYVHTVHAVDVESLGIDPSSSCAVVGFNLRFHAVGRAQIVPIYGV